MNKTARALTVVFGILSGVIRAATLASGSATIDYDKAACDLLAAAYGPPPVLTLEVFFDQAAADALTYDDTLHLMQTNPPAYTNQIHAMNGATVTNLPFRTTQPTTFDYTPGDLTNHTGGIGLGGIARFRVTGDGALLYGDFTLQYSNSRHAFGGTGWYLRGNIPPAAAAYDLLNVRVGETPGTLMIAGDLCVSYEVANLLYGTPADALRDVGDFTFTAIIARSTPVISRASISGGNFIVVATNGVAGNSYALLSASDLALPLPAWTTNATGVFDPGGTASNAIPTHPDEPRRFYRLKQP